jgi:hypothetical protein
MIEKIKNNCIENVQGCWVWQGTVTQVGRPMCTINRKHKLVYKHAYEIFNGVELPPNTYLCHKCDNKLCCNPVHLFIGDNRINQLDYIAKHGTIKNGQNSGDTYANTGIKRKTAIYCPSNITDQERLEWYKNNAINIDSNGCWIWQRETGVDGYGRIRYKKKKHMAHRLLWMFANNKAPEDLEQLRLDNLVIRHKCPISGPPNKACCNPEHLLLGTRSENAIDNLSYSKSRNTCIATDEQIIEWLWIYETYLNEINKTDYNKVAGAIKYWNLANENCSIEYIRDVLRGKIFKHYHSEFFDWTPSYR